MTKILQADAEAIREAAAVLRCGGLVAFPTETVYGLGADAENESALRALFAAKGRPADHPVIVHLADASRTDDFAVQVPVAARKLAAAFWPGPMTLVLRGSARVTNLVTGRLETVGIRVPSHPVARALLAEFAGPIAAPSANRFGRVSCTRAQHVLQELDGRVDLILDGGDCQVGLESTIIDVSGPQPAILRPGAVTAEQIEQVLGVPVGGTATSSPRVPGALPSHYAPRARVELVTAQQASARAAQLVAAGNKVAVLTNHRPPDCPANAVFLPYPELPGDLAHQLYALLRRVDELQCDVALAVLPSEEGIGRAIADRLRRAAGPRSQSPES